MRFIIYLLYEFLKILSKIAIGVFYHPVTVINREKVNVPNPAILLSNHPNTLFDPLNIGIRIKRQLYFLANSGMFASKFGNWFFSNVHCIPIQRKSDKHAVNNKDSFKKASDFLTNGGLLYVAPEGESEVVRRLRPLKSGTARIALSTEAQNNWELGLLILPSGTTYQTPNYFRTASVVVGGDPIRVSDYRAAYEKDSFAAARQLTRDIRERMLPLIVHTEDDEQEELLSQIETLYRQENPLSPKADFFRSQVLVKELQNTKSSDLSLYNKLKDTVNQLFTNTINKNTNVEAVSQFQQGYSIWYQLFLLIIGFPLFIYGFINNALATLIPILITRKLNLYHGYSSTVKALTGLFTFAIFWSIQTYLVYHFTDSFWAALMYLLTLYPLGLLAWEYFQFSQQFRMNWRFRQLQPEQREALITERNSVWKFAKGLI